jgi:3-deoxy-D-manno-octulosonic-acid transferase
VRRINPALYICLETELWPVLLAELDRRKVGRVLVNGRLSAASVHRYKQIAPLMHRLINGFQALALIDEEDAKRFISLGADSRSIKVTGNAKFDLGASNHGQVRRQKQELLGLEGKRLFICGSTRTGEEEILLPVFERLEQLEPNGWVWLVAPRHLRRLELVGELLRSRQRRFDLLSHVKGHGREQSIVLVDSMGELADLYAAGDIVFCGGSLVDKGGHNIMEVVRWGLPVYFGPFMQDFRWASEMVREYGAGFQIASGRELEVLVVQHTQDLTQVRRAGEAARKLYGKQQGAAARQADLIEQVLQGRPPKPDLVRSAESEFGT